MTTDDKLLKNLVTGDELKAVYRKKKHAGIKSVKIGSEEEYLKDGWVIIKKGRKRITLTKPRPIADEFEDQIWRMLVDLGFNMMNRDNKFRIEVISGTTSKQIDVFAKDDETILIIECKASDEIKKRDLQKDMGEMVAIREDIRKTIYNIFGKDIRMAWIFATKNVIWSKPDLERAENYNIGILRDNDCSYYSQLTDHIGSSAKFQFLADIFKHKEIPGLDCVVPAIKGKMGKSTFYAFAIEPAKLLKIAYVCHRSKGSDKDTLFTYQRMLDKKRLKEIKKYIGTGGLFPNSLVINLESGKKGLIFDQMTTKRLDGQDAKTEAVLGLLYLPSVYKSAFIIDGQHRLYGFTDSEYASKTTIPVIAFENLDEVIQANLFIEINSKQKRVKTNLLEELVADTKWGSSNPYEQMQALTSKIVWDLGHKEIGSPIYHRIAASESKKELKNSLTLTSITSALKKTQLIGFIKKESSTICPGPTYSEDDGEFMASTLNRSKMILSSYLDIFKTTMPEHWNKGAEPGGYLCTNGGITSLIYVLKSITEYIDKKSIEQNTLKSVDLKTDELIEKISVLATPIANYFKTLPPENIAFYRQKLGLAGYQDCAYGMMEQIYNVYPDFITANLKEYMDNRKSKSNEKAKLITPRIHLMISEKVIKTLKLTYGEDENGWWFKGVPISVRKKVSERREEDPEHPTLEQSFDLIHYKQVILENWKLFEITFARGTGNKEKRVEWINKLNDIRKKIAHPERGIITPTELQFLEEIESWLSVQIIKMEGRG